MVMHARKPQRISDGYFEKHQAHPYQKYPSSSKSERRTGSEYVSSDSRYMPLHSPNGNVPHAHHHYHAADDRQYAASRASYPQKGIDKERDRDYKSSRTKYIDAVRSPKDKRSKDSDRERSNHERSDLEKKSRSSMNSVSVNRSSKYDKRSAAPTASSSSTSEWSEHISSSGKKYYYNCISEVSQWEKPREWDSKKTSSKDSTYTSRSNRDKRSSSRSGRREAEKSSKRVNNSTDRYWNSSRDEEAHERSRPKHTITSYEAKDRDGQSLQDMDISPDRSTPLSENSYAGRETNTTTVRNNAEAKVVPPVVVLDNSHQTSGSLLAAALPRIVAGPPVVAPPATITVPNNGSATPESPQRDAGPPTPTHSENTDPHAPPLHLDAALPKKMECLGSYSSVVGSGNMHHVTPMMSPSLVNYMRPELATHVAGWPADILDKQAHKFTEEAFQLGCLQCTRVSAELKCSRSVVRHTEIQATLQEQKIMYLRQQISRLVELKSQNSFMSED